LDLGFCKNGKTVDFLGLDPFDQFFFLNISIAIVKRISKLLTTFTTLEKDLNTLYHTTLPLSQFTPSSLPHRCGKRRR